MLVKRLLSAKKTSSKKRLKLEDIPILEGQIFCFVDVVTTLT